MVERIKTESVQAPEGRHFKFRPYRALKAVKSHFLPKFHPYRVAK
jgi:hypothetical protein